MAYNNQEDQEEENKENHTPLTMTPMSLSHRHAYTDSTPITALKQPSPEVLNTLPEHQTSKQIAIPSTFEEYTKDDSNYAMDVAVDEIQRK
jgi:hypothetical protein